MLLFVNMTFYQCIEKMHSKSFLPHFSFYRCIEKRHSKSFLPHFATFLEILLQSCRKITAGICVSLVRQFFHRIQNVGL